MYERYMFQNRPTKFAKRTRYCMGTKVRLIMVARGQIFQFVFIVYQIFFS